MESSSIIKKNGRFELKYIGSESFYKNGLLLECVQYFKDLMKGKLLDLGCGNKPYSEIYNEVCDSSTGCDVPFSIHQKANVEVVCKAEDIDRHFEPHHFDCVLCTEVLEHTVNDQKVMENINRILKLDGNLLLSAPFTYVLHEAPYDHKRYTLYGLKEILESHNFEVKSIFSIGATFSSGFYIYYYSFTKMFYFAFKKIGFYNLGKNFFVKSIIDLPEYIFFKLYITFFKRKLRENKFPTKNEMFSSLGYFVVAKKVNDL